MYYFVRSLVRFVLPLLFRVSVTGAQLVPEEGPVLLCSTHGSNWDPILLGASVNRKVAFMAKEELFRFPPLAMLLRTFDAFPIRRGAADRQAMRIALGLLDQGRLLVMFPEGHRRPGAERLKIERGVGMLAARSDAVIVPVLLRGSYRWFQPLRITFGEPFRIEAASEPDALGDGPGAPGRALSGARGRDLVDRATELIETKMQDLITAARAERASGVRSAP